MKKYCNHCGKEVNFVEYSGEQYAVLWENSHAVLRENSHAVLRDNSHAVLRENSHAVLWENSHAVLWGNSHAELRDNSHAQCRSPYACGILKSITASCIGRSVGGESLTPKEYLASCGLIIKNQYVILYKSVNKNFISAHTNEVQYIIGKEVVAHDWDAKFKGECGHGLHLSPTARQASSFHNDNTYLACRVNLKDIASLPAFAQYPDKIRVRACVPLYQVDIEGSKIKTS